MACGLLGNGRISPGYNAGMLTSVSRAWRVSLMLGVPLILSCALLNQAGQVVSTSPATLAPTSFSPAAPTASSLPTPNEPPAEPTAMPITALPDAATANWQSVVPGLAEPVDAASAGDDRLFIVQQSGTIVILRNGQLQATPFLNLRDRVNTSGTERGLLGLAFDPDFAHTGDFYVDYTGRGGDTFVSRFHAAPEADQADAADETILLHIQQPYPNHNGGHLAFGPDGDLYIGMGDGGSGGDPLGNGQNLSVLLGKLLRIDVRGEGAYTIPPDNPFSNSSGPRPEIWAYGLRNPWRFAFDPTTGDLYLADVGQNQWEEVNFQPAGSAGGQNYGWSLREGFHEYSGNGQGLTEPVVEYSHNDGCSISGGVVVRDPSLPGWQGVYLYADYCSGTVWGLLRMPDDSWLNDELFHTHFAISGFGQDASGQVYLLDHNGSVYRLAPSG